MGKDFLKMLESAIGALAGHPEYVLTIAVCAVLLKVATTQVTQLVAMVLVFAIVTIVYVFGKVLK